VVHIDTMNDDFDDFDDLDDGLLDDDWDAFDDDGDTAQTNSSPDNDAPAAAPMQKKASALPRLIAVFVILLLIIGASYFFYSQFIVPAANQKRQELALQSNNGADNTPVAAQETADTNQTIEGFPPTPTPLSSDSNDDADELIPVPDLENIAVEQLPAPSSQNSYEIEQNSYVEDKEDAVIDSFEDIFADVEEEQTAVVEAAPISNSVDQDTIANLQKQNDTLQAKLSDYEQKIVSLEKKLSAAPAVQPVTKKASKPQKTTVTSSSKPRKSTSKPKARPVKKWVLRSAQPGQAVVAQKGSSDVRTIEVGDRVSGIGRVQSISNSSGLWVVQGTSGKISQ